MQPHEYHQIPTYVIALAKTFVWPYLPIYGHVWPHLPIFYFPMFYYPIHYSQLTRVTVVNSFSIKIMKHWDPVYKTRHELVWTYQIKNLYSESWKTICWILEYQCHETLITVETYVQQGKTTETRFIYIYASRHNKHFKIDFTPKLSSQQHVKYGSDLIRT